MSRCPKNAPRFCGYPVNPAIVDDLQKVMNYIPSILFQKLKTGGYVTQGWKSGVSASNGTHDDGYCIDIVTRHLTKEEIIELCDAFNGHNFAAVWRYYGVNMGTAEHPNFNKTEHIHIAWKDKANYNLIHPLVQVGGKYYIRDLIKEHR